MPTKKRKRKIEAVEGTSSSVVVEDVLMPDLLNEVVIDVKAVEPNLDTYISQMGEVIAWLESLFQDLSNGIWKSL